MSSSQGCGKLRLGSYERLSGRDNAVREADLLDCAALFAVRKNSRIEPVNLEINSWSTDYESTMLSIVRKYIASCETGHVLK